MIGKFAAILFIALTLVLLAYMLLNERRMHSKVPWWLRGIAVFVAVAALVGLALPISYQRAVAIDPAQRIHVLTRGIEESVVDSLMRLPNCYTTDTVLAKKGRIPFIEDWFSWLASHRQAHFSIYGFGLSPEELASLDRKRGDYRSGPLPKGLVYVDWNQEINRGSDIFVRGMYRPVAAVKTKIYLMSGGEPVDSTTLPVGNESRFELIYRPKQEGKTVLHIAAVEQGDTLQYEKVALMVQPPRTYSVLMLGASPSAEYKFLYNWLLASHYQVFYRTRISKEKFLYSETNPASTRHNKNLIEQLKSTDLLLIDGAEWAQLKHTEQEEINRALINGMGIVLMGGADSPRTGVGRFFEWNDADQHGQQRASIRFWGEDPPGIDLLVSDLIGLRNDGKLLPLVYANEHLVAAARLHGAGHIIALSLHNTYSWWLQGAEENYAGFWSKLFSLTLRDKKKNLDYMQWPQLPIPNQWTKLVLKDVGKQPVVRGINWRMPTLSDPWIPANKVFSFWPEESGWNELSVDKDTLAIYAYDEADWRSLRDEDRRTINGSYFSTVEADLTADNGIVEEVQIPKWIFYLLFFVSTGILWYAWRDYN